MKSLKSIVAISLITGGVGHYASAEPGPSTAQVASDKVLLEEAIAAKKAAENEKADSDKRNAAQLKYTYTKVFGYLRPYKDQFEKAESREFMDKYNAIMVSGFVVRAKNGVVTSTSAMPIAERYPRAEAKLETMEVLFKGGTAKVTYVKPETKPESSQLAKDAEKVKQGAEKIVDKVDKYLTGTSDADSNESNVHFSLAAEYNDFGNELSALLRMARTPITKEIVIRSIEELRSLKKVPPIKAKL